MKYPLIVCEIGCNHMGDREMAKEMVKVAAMFCKVDAVKFQKRHPRETLTPEQYAAPHPNPVNSFGRTYGEHRENLEFPISFHKELKELCESLGVIYSTSVWDMTSAREVAALNPQFIKIPSAKNLHWEMLDYLCANYAGEIHVSLGMTTQEEETQIVDFFKKAGRAGDLVLYACTSGYPVDDKDVCLYEITRLQQKFDGVVKGVGFSGHHRGIAIDMAAVTLGAGWIERHFTLDRTLKGTDHAASLEPDGMRRVKRDSIGVRDALSYKSAPLLPVEIVQREKLKSGPESNVKPR